VYLGKLSVEEGIILKSISAKTVCENVDWIRLAKDRACGGLF
jgi:hypothetical protein